MSKEIEALDLVLFQIGWLRQDVAKGYNIGNAHCNNWKDGRCTVHEYECKIGDKSCLEYDCSELLTQIDNLIDILENSLNPPVLENKRVDKKEMINHPQHYNMGKYEAIDVIEDWQLNFNLGNTVKYISRAGHKDNIVQDLKKASWYLDREIKRLEKGE